MARQPKPDPKYNPDELPCPVCDEKDYVWGEMLVTEPYRKAFINLDPLPRFAVRLCQSCGNVQTFIRG